MRASLFALPIWLSYTMAVMNFIKPSRYGVMGDYRSNVAHPIGYNMSITWTPGVKGKKAAVQVYQINITTGSIFFGEAETIAEGVDLTAWNWIVSTKKDLARSNIFQLALVQEGSSTYDDWGHYFNITAADGSDANPPSPATSGTIIGATPTPTNTPLNRPTGTGLPNESATTTTPASEASQKEGSTAPSTGAKIALGVSIPLAAIIGLVVGWLVLGRRRKGQQQQQQEGAAAAAFINNTPGPPMPKHAAQEQQQPWTPHELPLTRGTYHIDNSSREIAHEMPAPTLQELPSTPQR